MKRLLLLALVIMIAPTLTPAENTPVAPNGIAPYSGYVSGKVIASSQRENKKQIRITTGNEIAAPALRAENSLNYHIR